ASLDTTVCLWDARNMGKHHSAPKVSARKPLATLPHARSVNSAHFAPAGAYLVTTCQDDRLHLYDTLAFAAALGESIAHNNQTGRWLTKFQAVWDPKASDLFVCGSMSKGPHGIDAFNATAAAAGKPPIATRLEGGEVMTSIQSVVACHPRLPLVAGINASGRCHVFRQR
ncbi:hypothetical protein JKP88DRAFT_171117, partial [Tribonema minus]